MGYSLGIDLGTTFTAAATARDGRVDIVPLGNHAATIPSLVFLREDETVLIGDAAERRGQQDPARLAREFKRRFGDTTPILLDRTPFSAERLMAVILRQVLADVSARQGAPPDTVGVAHPANWGQFKFDLLRQAVQLAGVGAATFVTEPVAAAIQYASTERVDVGHVIAVYDLGGGTFDAAVLRKSPTGFDTLGQPQGIERLGGIDFDEAVFAHVRRATGGAIDQLDTTDPGVRAALARLRDECVAAKESLSSDSDATISVLLPNIQTQVRLTRAEFEEMIRPTLRETVDTLRRAIAMSGVEMADLKGVLLAGGSSRIPLVAEMVRGEFGLPVVSDAHPKHAVALGAARVAASVGVPAPPPPPPPPPTSSAPATLIATPAVAAPLGITPSPYPSPPPPSPTPAWKKPWVIGLVAVLLIAVGVGAAVALSSDNNGNASSLTTTPASIDSVAPTASVAATEPPATPLATSAVTEPATTTATTAATTEPSTSTTLEATTTTMPLPEFVCGASGRCVRITSIARDLEGVFTATYETMEFDPFLGPTPTDFHVHFYFNSISLDNAGTPTDLPLWVAWDRSLGGGELVFSEFSTTNAASEYGGSGATEMCIAVADHNHAIERDTNMCQPLGVTIE